MSESGSGNPVDSSTDSDKDSSVYCPDCGKEYANYAGLKYHLKTDGNDCKGEHCRVCGKACFLNMASLSTHMANQHDGTPVVSKSRLLELYEDKSTRDVADAIGVSKPTIVRYLRYYDLPVEKSPSDKPPTFVFDKMSDRVGHEYARIRPHIDGEHYTIGIHRLVAIAHGKLDPKDMWGNDFHVHHKNKHGLDNRPDNLEVMTASDHISMHQSN